MEPLKFRDNTPDISIDKPEKYCNLRNIANRPISELKDEKGFNLLIFPHSLKECDDEAGKQCIFSLQDKWKDEKCISMSVSTGNLMGFIGIGDVKLSIQSRFAQQTKDDYFLHYMLQKVLSINLFNLKHNTSDEQVFDFLLYLFPKYLNEALSQGLFKAYKYQEYNDANVKGVIDINQHIRRNMPFNGQVAYRTREFSYDNPVTQLVRHTIEYIRHHNVGRMILLNDAETQASVSRIIYATPTYNVQSRQTVIKKNIRPVQHPYFTHYRVLQKLCLKILHHEGLKYGTKKDEVYGIMFDGAWLWEEYLATLLVPKGFKHPQNLKSKGTVYLGKGKKLPRYPDFYDIEENGIILDAKYKRYIDTRNDINQMVTYLYLLKGCLGGFIQPTDEPKITEEYPLLGYGVDNKAQIGMFNLLIPQKTNSQKEFNFQIKNSEMELYHLIQNYKH